MTHWLDKFIEQAKAQEAGDTKAAYPRATSVNLDALIASVHETSPDEESVEANVRSALQRIASKAPMGAKPSWLFGELRDSAFGSRSREHEFIVKHPGRLLAEFRRLVPRQVPVPSGGTPKGKRKLPRGGVLMGHPYAAECFAGGGLFSLAMHIEGIYVGDICEIDIGPSGAPRQKQWAIETLKTNLHDFAVAADAMVWTPLAPEGGLDVLAGGPPCQPWSKGKSLSHKRIRGPKDPRNMYPRILEWIADAPPRVLCLENSAEIARDPSFIAYFEWWFEQLAQLGYEGTTWVISAASYGSPQDRRRAFVLAWPKGSRQGASLRSPPPATHGRPGTPDVESGKLLPWTRVFDRLNSGCCANYGLHTCVNLGNLEQSCRVCVDGLMYKPAPNYTDNQIRQNLTEAGIERTLGEFGDSGTLRIEKFKPIPASEKGRYAFSDLRWDEKAVTEYLSPVPTVRWVKNAPYGLLVPEGADPWGDVDRYDPKSVEAFVRQLMLVGVRDAAKIMDVPQWYKFEGGRTAALKQIGNGIPVNMGRAVARHLVAALGQAAPLSGTMAAKPWQGLWPIDRVNPCAGYPGVVGYPEAWSPSWPDQRAITSQERRKRPFASSEDFEDMRMWRKHVSNVRGLGVEGGGEVLPTGDPGFWEYTPQTGDQTYHHDWAWRPGSTGDAPPGFIDFAEFENWIQGEDVGVINHYGQLMDRKVWADDQGFVRFHADSPFADYRVDRRGASWVSSPPNPPVRPPPRGEVPLPQTVGRARRPVGSQSLAQTLLDLWRR